MQRAWIVPSESYSTVTMWLAAGFEALSVRTFMTPAPEAVALTDTLAFALGKMDAGGYRHLVDSNLDWGQDLPGLKAWMDRNGVARIKLSYFGTADLDYHRIDCDLLPGQMLPPPRDVTREIAPGDIVAVSATNLQGVYLDPADRPLMERLRAQDPVATIGHSILVYRAGFAWPAR